MPSPLAHASWMFLVRAFVRRDERLRQVVFRHPFFFYASTVATLWAADGDFLIRLAVGPVVEHGGATHSFAVGVLFGAMFMASCRLWYGRSLPLMSVLVIGILCAWAHPLMDMATWRGGAALLWPWSSERFATIPLFYGVRHSEPTAWRLHAITFATELFFIVPLWWAAARLGGSTGHASKV